jgi:3-oxo-5-alpha-steroid 4-dehydrogenase 3
MQSNESTAPADQSVQKPATRSGSIIEQVLDFFATVQVPHGYFQHFYLVSVLSSVFWAYQLLAKGWLLQYICQENNNNEPKEGMSVDQVALAWSFMGVQGLRRLLESSTLARPSASKMWFVHWLLGTTFYLAVGISVWVEGAGVCASTLRFILQVEVY